MESDVNSNSFHGCCILINRYYIVINGFETLLHKLGVNLKHNLKAIGKLFSANFVSVQKLSFFILGQRTTL